MVINLDNILFSVAHANNGNPPAGSSPDDKHNENKNLIEEVEKNKTDEQSSKSQFETLQQQVTDLQTEIGNKTSLLGIDTGNILVGSVVVELILFILILFLILRLSNEQNRSSRMITKQKEKIEDLTRKVEKLERNAEQQKMSAPVTNWSAPPKPVPETQHFNAPRPIERPPEPRPLTAEDKYKDFVKDFNALVGQSGMNLKNARSDFMRKYNVQTFTCTNFEARMNEPVPAPIFDSANSAANPDYWAYEFESGVFAVVPNVKIYSDNHHTARAMGEVFTSNFTAGRTYSDITVEQPAIFDCSETTWILKRKGILRLG